MGPRGSFGAVLLMGPKNGAGPGAGPGPKAKGWVGDVTEPVRMVLM